MRLRGVFYGVPQNKGLSLGTMRPSRMIKDLIRASRITKELVDLVCGAPCFKPTSIVPN